MALTKMEDDLNIIAALDDEPNDVGGLSAAELKGKFDEAAKTVQKYINEVLIPELEKMAVPGTGDFKADGTVPMSGELDMSGYRVVGLGAPVDDADALRKVDLADYAEEVSGAFSKTEEKLEEVLQELASVVGSSPKIMAGSYTGTGTCGINNPNILTFDFAPKLVWFTYKYADGSYSPIAGENNAPIIDMQILTTSFKKGSGPNTGTAGNSGKKSSDGKSVYWYGLNAEYQANVSGHEYYWIAFG